MTPARIMYLIRYQGPQWFEPQTYFGNNTLKDVYDYEPVQADWKPEDSPSLWVGISDPAEEWPEWSQPVGSTDAYAKGAKVSHNGKHWTSDVDANVWEPGAYGWTETTA